jgi:oligopeptide transport system substrate-binding protein
MMVTDMYTTEVDWAKAIEDGVADAPGDFSKIEAGEFSVDALDYVNVLLGAAAWPADADGEQHLTEDGTYDRDNGTSTMSTEWTFQIRDDLFFENGDAITAYDYEYTVKMFLDPLLNNSRADMFYKQEGERSGTPLVNGYEYWADEADWADVGFTVNDDYSFTMTFWETVSQSAALGYANNIRLAHQASFEASLDSAKTNSSYGTPLHPFVSYGEYILKTWDADQKLVFNKNFDYVAKGTINYKCIVVEIVEDLETRMQLFEQGKLSVTGLSKEYYTEYAEADNVYRSWRGYPQYILINVAPSALTEGANVHDEIMFDARFRQALIYGFDRKYYANSVYQPNTPSIMPIPLDTKIYLQDVLYYSQSPQHLAVLEQFSITEENLGYIPTLAVSLFDAAYADWVADGNTGPVTLSFVSDNDEFTKGLVDYVEESYEALFNTAGQVDKLDVVIEYKEREAARSDYENWDYDLILTSIGFGSSTGAHWQFPSLSFFGGMLAPYLGLTEPYDESTESGLADYWTAEVEVELANTWAYLEEYTMDAMVAEELDDWIELYEWLAPVEDDAATADVDETKAAGVYRGPLSDIAFYPYTASCPWDATASEPYPGATVDMWELTAMFEEVFLSNGISIPTVTRSDATIYADNVQIEWPFYSVAFGWGAQRYRYLDTDPDFME